MFQFVSKRMFRHLLAAAHMFAAIFSFMRVATLRPLLARRTLPLMPPLGLLLASSILSFLPHRFSIPTARPVTLLLFAASLNILWVATLRPSLAHMFLTRVLVLLRTPL